ncbi:MAG TPA: hypothetical protein ENF80_00420 [Thermofilum sp.]|nr:hypothetical protein [Thermofilum sp.]
MRSLKSLKEEARITVVGDGINDAPALAVADIGIAIGSLQAVAEAADVAIVTNNVSEVVSFFKLSRKVYRGIIRGIMLVLISKAMVILLSAIKIIPLWAAVAIGDDGSLLLALATTFLTLSRRN